MLRGYPVVAALFEIRGVNCRTESSVTPSTIRYGISCAAHRLAFSNNYPHAVEIDAFEMNGLMVCRGRQPLDDLRKESEGSRPQFTMNAINCSSIFPWVGMALR